MNKTELIKKGTELEQITELSKIRQPYETWKEMILRYASQENTYMSEQCRIKLHLVEIPFESEETKIKKYYACIKSCIQFLEGSIGETDQKSGINTLNTIIKNFDLFLQNMFRVVPENKATLPKDALERIAINNEYDVQHIMYAVVKALYPSARREVNQDTGYGTVRFDIVIEEIDTVIEIKCTRKDHSEGKLFRELGEDGYFYNCSRLIIYVYDKTNVIRDVGNFIKALSRTQKDAGKDVVVYVNQTKELI